MAAGLIISLCAAVIAIVAHEISHGWAARLLGDDTAYRMNRLSLNPLHHVDPFGTIILPAVLSLSHLPVFGWAKPVPVDFSRLRNPTWAVVIVAAAGIVTNLILAFVSASLIVFYAPFMPDALKAFLSAFTIVNLVLALFNLIPVPPLDGSKIFFGWIQKPWAQKYVLFERQMIIPLLLVLIILPWFGRQFGAGGDILTAYFNYGLGALFRFIRFVYGP